MKRERLTQLKMLLKDDYGVPMMQVDFSQSEQDEAVKAKW